MAQSKLKRSELSKAAKEINDIMQPNPAINTKAEKDELESKLVEAGELVDPEQDEFSEPTWKVMETLGAAHRPKSGGPGEDEETGEGEDDSGEDAGEKQEPKQQSQSSNKGGGKKQQSSGGKGQQKSSGEGKKKTKVQERVEFLTPLIQEGKYTKKELVEKLQNQFDMSASAAQTLLTDAKNSKYTKFHAVVVEDENKVMSFKEG